MGLNLQSGGRKGAMKHQSLQAEIQPEQQTAPLDLVVPFTTPDLTRIALKAAERLSPGLHASVRLLKVQVVPFPMQQSPVHLGFLKKQLEAFQTELPISAHILLTRDYELDLMRALRPDSIVILASKRRLWRTRNESLASTLRRNGHRVLVVYTSPREEGSNHA
jgi:hypothetical protein